MLKLLLNHKVYFIAYAALMLSGLTICISYSQINISVFVNANYHIILDYLTYFGTTLGDGLFAIVVGLLFLFKDKKLAFTIILAYLISAGFAQLLKHTFFTNFNRPFFYVEPKSLVHLVFKQIPHSHNSFPSGHTTSAFALFTVLTLQYKKSIWAIMLASFVAYTRIYLFQHFLMDVLVGSFIGLFCATWCYFYFYQKDKFKIILQKFKKH